jgi:carboxymethylenebutenolidase
MIEHLVEIATLSGSATTFICHPERNGPHPVILFYMDAPGIREELRDMARRLATTGYYVMLPNLYYRLGVYELGPFAGAENMAVREKMMGYMATLTIPMVMEDTDAFVSYLNNDPAASKGPMGCVGYCMSGRYALGAASRYPERVAAAASIYGTKLVTDDDNSPHVTAQQAKAELYVACAENDHYVPAETVMALRLALQVSGMNAEVELYPGTEHGFAFPGRAAYNKAAAERHWERLFALFGRTLGDS